MQIGICDLRKRGQAVTNNWERLVERLAIRGKNHGILRVYGVLPFFQLNPVMGK